MVRKVPASASSGQRDRRSKREEKIKNLGFYLSRISAGFFISNEDTTYEAK